jgi:hypothetical protein
MSRHEQRPTEEARTANSTYKKLAVQWLNEALCFVSSSVVADSLVLRNRQLLVAAKRWPYSFIGIINYLLILDMIGAIFKSIDVEINKKKKKQYLQGNKILF